MSSVTPVQPLQQKSSLHWVDPLSLPNYGDASTIGGNAPDTVKQLTSNTFGGYGVGDEACFAYSIGRTIRILSIDIMERKDGDHPLVEARTITQLVVTKGRFAQTSASTFWLSKFELFRYVECKRCDARWLSGISHRHVRIPSHRHSITYSPFFPSFAIAARAVHWSHSVSSSKRTMLA
jgi:hypothetical protein